MTEKLKISNLVLLALVTLEVYFLIFDFGPRQMKTNPLTQPIAQLMRRQNDVRIQDNHQIIWEEVQDQQMLFRQQSLLTLDQSKAEIAFLDGTGLVLDENSLIQIENISNKESQNRIVIHLLRGTLHKKKMKAPSQKVPPIEMNIEAAHSIASFGPETELTISKPENNETAIIVVEEGASQIQTPKESVSLQAGQKIQARPEAPLQVQSVPFFLIAPMGGEVIESIATAEIQFRWRVADPSFAESQIFLEVSQDPLFKKDVKSQMIPPTEPPLEFYEVKLSLPVENKSTPWYWRVRSQNQYSSKELFWIRLPAQKPSQNFVEAVIQEWVSAIPKPSPKPTAKIAPQLTPKTSPKKPPPPQVFAPQVIPIRRKK